MAAALVFAKWCLANAIAAQSPLREVAELSVNLAPDDPQTHYALAVLDEKNFLPEDLAKSLAEFEQAAALAPHDFRLWLAFGKARERGGDAAGAELALRKASELAPNYAQVQWTLGNVLLRRGKSEEAFAEIRRAAENDAAYRIPAVTTAWQIFDGDVAQIKQNFGNSNFLKSAFAVFLAKQKQFDEAMDVWNSFIAAEKTTLFKQAGEELLKEMLAAKKFHFALKIQKEIYEPSVEDFAFGKIYNGSFEIDVKREQANAFDWQIADGNQPQIGFDDAQKHDGSRSLVMIFNSSDGKDFRQISQTVAVESKAKYVFGTFYKSELKTAATLRWEIADAADGKILAATDAVSSIADWTNLKTEFTVPENTQAVTIRLMRENCKSIVCPIAGKIWFDDFSVINQNGVA